MFRIMIIAVNEDCEEREARLVKHLAEKVSACGSDGFEVIDISDLKSIDDMVKRAKEEADRTVIVFDAVRGMNPSFSYAASELYRKDIRPILLIASADSARADIKTADCAVAEIWSAMDPGLESWDLYFHNLYFSYQTGGIDTAPEVKSDGVDALIRLLS